MTTPLSREQVEQLVEEAKLSGNYVTLLKALEVIMFNDAALLAENERLTQERNADVERMVKATELIHDLHALLAPTKQNLQDMIWERDDLLKQLAAAQARVVTLEEALTWIMNLHHGVSRNASDGFHHGVTDEEWSMALEAGKQALAPPAAGEEK